MAVIPKLKSTIGRNYSVEEDDTLTMKNVLKKLGYYETPNYGMTPFPDEPMFEGVRGFQKAKGLLVDGIVAPRGPTARALGEALNPTVPRRAMIAAKAAATGRPVGGTAFGGLLRQAPSPKERPDTRPTGSERGVATRFAQSTGRPGAATAAPRSPQPPPRAPLKGGMYSGTFLDAIAKAEHNVKGYAEVNPDLAWGRYQMTSTRRREF